MFEVREASESDWPNLAAFFDQVYRVGHPLRRQAFWHWQFGEREWGRSFVVVSDSSVLGHVGAYFVDQVAWIINVFLDEQLRGQGYLRRLYDLARDYFPVAATNINKAGLDMYRSMGFIRYCDLQRYVLIRPKVDPAGAIAQVKFTNSLPKPTGHHYWSQPGISGVVFDDGSSGVLQSSVGGIRAVEIADPARLANSCWGLGARWIDYVTSWNDPMCKRLEQAGWTNGDPIPYRLNPLVEGSRSNISFVSEKPLPNNFIVRRYHSDHGRISSLPD